MAFTSDAAGRRARRKNANAAPAAKHETAGPGRRRAAERLSLSQSPEFSQASQDVAFISRQESGEEKLGLLWADIEDQMLALLAQGLAAPFQRSAFNKLEYAMKHYEKQLAKRAEQPNHSAAAALDADELAALLGKIDRRIDALAEDRFEKLAGTELHDPGADAGRPGMDV